MTEKNPTEESLRELINSDKNKSVVISGKKYFIGKHVKEQVKERLKEGEGRGHEGGILPLMALIPAIIAGLSGAAGLAGGIATTVQKAKESQKTDLEKQKLQTEIEKLRGTSKGGKGAGLYLDPYKGRGLNDFLKNQISSSESLSLKDKEDLKKMCKSLKNGCLCKIGGTPSGRNGEGLYLKPYSNGK